MRIINSIKNISVDLIFFIANMLIKFILIRVIITNLGAEYAGLNSFFSQVVGYLNLADLGFSTASLYKLYKPIRLNDESRIEEIHYGLNYIYKILTLLILFIGFIVSLKIDIFINASSSLSIQTIQIYFLIFLVSVLIPNLYIDKLTIIQSTQKLYKINIYIYTLDFIKSIMQIVAIIVFNSFLYSLICVVFISLVKLGIVQIYYLKNYTYKKSRNIDVVKELIRESKDIFAHKFSSVIVDGTDYITLSTFTSLTNVNLFANYNILFTAVKGIVGKLFQGTTPSVGDMIIEGNIKKIREVFYKMLVLNNLFTLFAVFGLLNYTKDFITIWIGNIFVLSKFTLVLFIVNFYINSVMSVFVIFKGAQGLYKDDVKFVYLQALSNLFFSILLVQKYDMNGVLIGTLIGNSIGLIYPKINIVYNKVLKQEVKILLRYYYKLIVISIIALIISTSIKSLIDHMIEITGVLSFIQSISVYVLTFGTIYILLFSWFDEIRNLLESVYKKLRSKNKSK